MSTSLPATIGRTCCWPRSSPRSIRKHSSSASTPARRRSPANYAPGKDRLAGFKTTFKGEVLGEEYTVWPTQLDFSAELSKARNSRAESIFVFYPGAAGVQFLNQYVQAGIKAQIPLYTAFTVD